MSLRELLAYNRFVSSAKWCIFEFFIDRLKSFMYMRNNKGHKMEPYGTPFNGLDFRSFIIDGCILSSVTEIAFEPIKSYSSDAVMV